MEIVICNEININVTDNHAKRMTKLTLGLVTGTKIVLDFSIDKLELGMILQDEDTICSTVYNNLETSTIGVYAKDYSSISFNRGTNHIEIIKDGVMYVGEHCLTEILDYLKKELDYLCFDAQDVFTLRYYWSKAAKDVDIIVTAKEFTPPRDFQYKVLTDNYLLSLIKNEECISDGYVLTSELLQYDDFKILSYFKLSSIKVIKEYSRKQELEAIFELCEISTVRDYMLKLASGYHFIRRQFSSHADVMESALSNIINSIGGNLYDRFETGAF